AARLVAAGQLHAGQVAEGVSDHALPFAGRVRVDHRSPGAAMPHALYQLAQIRTRTRSERVPCVPQIVESHALQPNLGKRWRPHAAAKVALAQLHAAGAGEDEPGCLRLRVPRKVLAQVRDNHTREDDLAATSRRLGRPKEVLATRSFSQRTPDLDGTVSQVD